LLRRIAELFRPYRGRVALVVVLILVTSGLGVVNPLLTKQVFDRALFPARCEDGVVLVGGDIVALAS
jgi:ATP-binding cassette, subfamily B, bacterial